MPGIVLAFYNYNDTNLLAAKSFAGGIWKLFLYVEEMSRPLHQFNHLLHVSGGAHGATCLKMQT